MTSISFSILLKAVEERTLKKLFWGFLTLASTVLLCLHLWIMISGYIAYDSVTNIISMRRGHWTFLL
ncbi:hypothetical protein EB796_019892 [Bugula neritina]|uniref:Uncharacterized protein n=1 Tax=Bugula neritina TaxID=10212 RepID=A0A7J7J6L4_BUGNE|nr:hypothetical protein EB796_019892 [Bugula neritina]